jgi:hypothetical protein
VISRTKTIFSDRVSKFENFLQAALVGIEDNEAHRLRSATTGRPDIALPPLHRWPIARPATRWLAARVEPDAGKPGPHK